MELKMSSTPRGSASAVVRIVFVSSLFLGFSYKSSVVAQNPTIEQEFASSLVTKYGTNGTLSSTELATMLRNILRGGKDKHSGNLGADSSSPAKCNASIPIQSQTSDCYMKKCLSADDIFQLHTLNGSINSNQLDTISSTVLFTAQNYECSDVPDKVHRPPSAAEVWGYGFLFVTVISGGSLIGVLVLPFMKKSFYETILTFMVALAVGSLAGSGLLFLIPDALGLGELYEDPRDYAYLCTTVIGGIYLFFMLERIMKLIMSIKQRNKCEIDLSYNDLPVPVCSAISQTHLDTDPELKVPPTLTADGNGDAIHKTDSTARIVPNNSVSTMSIQNAAYESEIPSNGKVAKNSISHRHGDRTEKREIAPVAWMIIFGDALHNFIDGLSIGAAFSDKILSGISISLAVICEELPHELGDFAILLNSGMTVRQAVLYNLLSACTCYVGLIIGIVLGENTSLNRWIFAVAGGMFLYISLADMMPEMNHAVETEKNRTTRAKLKTLLIQNLGLMTGYGVMLLMAIYGGEIEL
ncbi:metal cation symporter ZIP8-like isoform X2 [Tubulanus polymorphus]|uniref:metal cation symporter ZIP8-like isoform X2 n=1 Tax=Tubulanus polymorphus TaxID=672921 RepID=UPI003DA693EA